MSKIENQTISSPYIDRRVAEGIFRELLNERPTYRVFNIYGKSGSGKSAFVEHIKDKYLKNRDFISVNLNFNDRLLHKPQKAIMHIAKELEQNYGFNFLALWKAYAILWHKRYEHSPIMYAADLPYFEEIKKIFNPKSNNKNIISIAKGIFGNKLSKELESLKQLDTKSIEDKIYKFFAADLRRIVKESKYKDCVIILENVDRLKEYNNSSPCSKDSWIRDLITQVGKDALFLISAKEQLNWQQCNSSWKMSIKEYEMKNFTKKDSLKYLTHSGINDNNLKDAIVISASNEPFWLSLATVSYIKNYKKLPTNKLDILKAFYKTNEDSLGDLLKILVHSRFFTKELIDTIQDKFNISATPYIIDKLLTMPFIKKLDKKRYIIDDAFIEKTLELQSQKEIVEYKAFMFSYYENILQTLDEELVKATPQLVDEAIEEAWYYLNNINNEPLVHFEWLDYYIDRFFMYAAWEPFLERYSKIVPQLKKSEDKVSKNKLVALYNNLAGLYESLGDTKISKKYYDLVINLNRPELLSA